MYSTKNAKKNTQPKNNTFTITENDVKFWYFFLADSDEEVEPEPDKNELHNMVKTLTAKLEDMNTCNDLIAKHGTGLQRALTEVESMDSPSEAGSKLKVINERATMFRITTNAMINVSLQLSVFISFSHSKESL